MYGSIQAGFMATLQPGEVIQIGAEMFIGAVVCNVADIGRFLLVDKEDRICDLADGLAILACDGSMGSPSAGCREAILETAYAAWPEEDATGDGVVTCYLLAMGDLEAIREDFPADGLDELVVATIRPLRTVGKEAFDDGE